MIYLVSVAAATAVVGADLFTNESWNRQSRHRVIRGIGMKGSAAAADTRVDFYAGETKVGSQVNDDTGVPNLDNLKPAGRIFIAAGDPVRAIVTDAATTNPINVLIDIADV